MKDSEAADLDVTDLVLVGPRKLGFGKRGLLEKGSFLGPAFGRTEFSRIFSGFLGRRFFFFRGFSRRIFSPHFCGKKVPRKILQENPRQNPPKFIQQNPRHISEEGPGQSFRKVHFLEIPEIFENRQTVENKGESEHSLEILENLEILEILEIPPAKRPLS